MTAINSGHYVLFDGTNKPFTTYCDFESDPGFAWTLIESLSLAKAKTSKYRRNFSYNTESDGCGVDWSEYRLSKTRMASVKNSAGSNYFRATCNFNAELDKGLLDHRDYLRVAFCRYNSLFSTSSSYTCATVDYFNVRGYSCRQCTIPIYFGNQNYHMYVDVSRATQSCSRLKIPDTVNNEEAFGRYQNSNSKFRCSNSSTSTTNWWIGGTLIE